MASGGGPERRCSTQEEDEIEQRKQDELISHLDSHERLASTFAASLDGENSLGVEPTMSGSGSFSRMDSGGGGRGGGEGSGNVVEDGVDQLSCEGKEDDVKGDEVGVEVQGEEGGKGDGREGEGGGENGGVLG